jgi:sugar/nucleoside kinase (ribokinase family)
MISAARLGMAVASIGHVNDDRFGKFMARVLEVRDSHLGLSGVHSP